MTEVEFFPKVSDRGTHSVQSVNRLLKWTTSNQKLKQNTYLYKRWLKDNPKAKKHEKSQKKVFYFPAVTFSGTFINTGKAEDINIMSGLIVLDFDHIVNLPEIQKKIKSDPFTFLLFVSPSGDGLKAVAKHNLKDPHNWRYLYLEFEAYYSQMFNGVNDVLGNPFKTDPSGKDISRMCFLPYIEDLYSNDKSVVWEYSGEYEKPVKTNTPKENIDLNTTELPDDLHKECLYISAYLFENKINITENYEDWLSYGYSLCALGEQGREIFHNISCISDKYDIEECDLQYDYMLSNFDENRTNILNFLNNGKRAIAHHTIFKQYGFLCS